MPQDRLTRHELSWLLAQEARGAARALREGVTQLKQPAAQEPRIVESAPVETTLDALDDAITMLNALHSGSRSKSRRGRIDLAALLYEVAPNTRIAIEPGAGTEVFGQEDELRRMLHLLVHQSDAASGSPGSAAAPEVKVRRQDSWVKISVELGPDAQGAAELERRWLSRMATRHGGWVELEGGTQSIFLPADGAADQREVVELRKELEQAQQLGEAYARELAAVLAMGDRRTEPPPTPDSSADASRFALLQGTARALERMLRLWLEELRADMALAQDLGESSPLYQNLQRRVTAAHELFGDLTLVVECPFDEAPSSVDLAALLREAAEASAVRSARHEIQVVVRAPESLSIESRPGALRLLVRSLLHHALAATPRGGEVVLSAMRTELGPMLSVEDGGPVVPEVSAPQVIQHRVDPTSFGRPAGLTLLIADVTGAYLGGSLALREGSLGRNEVWITLPAKPQK